MFGFIKYLFIFILVIAVLGFIAITVLPKSYEIQESIDIGAAQSPVFAAAKNLKNWIPLARMGNLPTRTREIPAHVQKQMDAQGIGGLLRGVQGASEVMKMKFKVIAMEAPKKIQYRIDGGPVSGAIPEVAIEKVEDKLSRVTITEKFGYKGFMGGLKALMARSSSSKLHQSNLEKLKKYCEK